MFSFSEPPGRGCRALRDGWLPEDLDQYLAESESVFSDIVPGAEKTIIWAGEPGRKQRYSIIYLHGFSATRQETAPLSDLVARHLGANLFYTRLTGHGRHSDALLEGSVERWLEDACEALAIGRRLGERVIVIGNSTGATLATWLAIEAVAEAIAAFVLLSPNFGLRSRLAPILGWPLRGHLAELCVGKKRCWRPQNELHARYWSNCYPTRSLLPMIDLVKMVNGLEMADFKKPVLVACSPKDQIIDSNRVERNFKRFGSSQKKLWWFEGSQDAGQHILAGDILSPKTTETLARGIVDFVWAVEKAPG